MPESEHDFTDLGISAPGSDSRLQPPRLHISLLPLQGAAGRMTPRRGATPLLTTEVHGEVT